MRRLRKSLIVGLCRFGVLVVVAVSVFLVGPRASLAVEETAEAEYLPGTPFAYLFDTGSSSPRPLSAGALAGKRGWTLVPEENTEHEFRGDAVLLNDKLSVVLRRKGPGAEVYARTPAGPRFRAVVMSADRKAVSVSGTSSVRIEENNPGAVELAATFRTDGPTGRTTAGYRITTGQAMLELTCGEGADRLFVWCKTRYSVVPDFFGHDMVFTPAVCDLPRFGLPAENFLLNLIAGGDAIVMCAWPSAEQAAHAVLTGEGPDRALRGNEIRGGPEETLSVAFLEATGIWHEAKAVDDDWKRPFDAKWRVDRITSGPWAVSSDLSPDGLEQRSFVYPLDRNAQTPLTAFCPVDVIRNTLGVGPCQYVLQSEGLASETNPTPAHVMGWVEEQFDKEKEDEAADEIEARLAAMADHVVHAQARIDQYAVLSRELESFLEASREDGQPSDAARSLSETIAQLGAIAAAGREQGNPAERAAELAETVVGLIGTDDVAAECRRLGLEARGIGARQDTTLSRCRMAVRWLREQARMSRLRDRKSSAWAGKILARAERFLEEG